MMHRLERVSLHRKKANGMPCSNGCTAGKSMLPQLRKHHVRGSARRSRIGRFVPTARCGGRGILLIPPYARVRVFRTAARCTAA